jgi:seryl-tRNA synthetase
MTHNKIKVDRKQLRRERLQKSYVDIVDEEHKDVPTGEEKKEIVVVKKVEEKVEKKTKRKYKKKEVKKE